MELLGRGRGTETFIADGTLVTDDGLQKIYPQAITTPHQQRIAHDSIIFYDIHNDIMLYHPLVDASPNPP